MTFNSISFLVFFPATTGIYFLLPQKARAVFLVAASCLFYAAFYPPYLLILLFTIAVDYLAGIWIEKSAGKTRKTYLLLSLAANLGCLAFFKYYHFLNENISGFMRLLGGRYDPPLLSILLPIGLSFHTFQAMSYTIEVYRENQKAEKNFLLYALYVLFFPQLVAGPIERPQNLLPQFREKHYFEYERVTSGLKRMLWGFFKKIVIADRLAIVVNTVYASPASHDGPALILATVFFSFQIYCDFSGYSDIAIGAARVLGFRLMENFKTPYFATSVSDFWSRWHISLCSWLRDYVYIPLGGNRAGPGRRYFNLMLTFLLSGLWHGAKWTFVLWGGLNGLYLICAVWLRPIRQKWAAGRMPDFMKASAVFALISFSWIFFRADSISDAFMIVGRLGVNLARALDLTYLSSAFAPGRIGMPGFQLLISLGLIGFLIAAEQLLENGSAEAFLRRSACLRWSAYYALLLGIAFLGVYEHSRFIYFQF